jgi:hypothetical protein
VLRVNLKCKTCRRSTRVCVWRKQEVYASSVIASTYQHRASASSIKSLSLLLLLLAYLPDQIKSIITSLFLFLSIQQFRYITILQSSSSSSYLLLLGMHDFDSNVRLDWINMFSITISILFTMLLLLMLTINISFI